jgi:hypothetical protein
MFCKLRKNCYFLRINRTSMTSELLKNENIYILKKREKLLLFGKYLIETGIFSNNPINK